MTRTGKIAAVAAATAVLAVALAGCGATTSATFVITSADGTVETTVDDISCTTSSVARVITSAAKNPDDRAVFTAQQPIPDRKAYVVAGWVDGAWFSSTEKFDAEATPITFDELPGTLTPSPSGGLPTGTGVAATLSGTITCP